MWRTYRSRFRPSQEPSSDQTVTTADKLNIECALVKEWELVPRRGRIQILTHSSYYDMEDGEKYAILQVKHRTGEPIWCTVQAFAESSAQNFELLKDYMDNVVRKIPNKHYPLFADAKVTCSDEMTEWETVVKSAWITGTDDHSELKYNAVFLDADEVGRGTFVDVKEEDVQLPPEAETNVVIQEKNLPADYITPRSLKMVMELTPDMREQRIAAYREEWGAHLARTIKGVSWDKLPLGVKLVSMTMLFDEKFTKENLLEKLKNRLVAGGNTQTYGVDYFETHAPTSQLATLRWLIVIALQLKLVVWHLDVKKAFINTLLEEDVYVRVPKEILNNPDVIEQLRDEHGKVTEFGKLVYSLYGLKQAGRNWYLASDKFMMSVDPDFKKSSYDSCLYYLIKRDDSGAVVFVALVLVYVDDYIVACSDEAWVKDFHNKFNKLYEVNLLGRLDQALGIAVEWGPHSVELSQPKMIQNLVDEYGLKDAHPELVPMKDDSHIKPSENPEPNLPFRNLIGALMWIARCTRPDILYAVTKLARCSAAYDHTHFKAAKRILLYLKGTVNKTLLYKANSASALKDFTVQCDGYADADYASDASSRRSTTGWVVNVFGQTVSYGSRLQKSVALSTTEAELMAQTELAKDMVFITNLTAEMFPVVKPVNCYCDNHGCVHVINGLTTTARSKHIQVREFYIRELVQDGLITVLTVPTDDNVSDILTKPLPLPKHAKFANILLGH